MAITKGRLRLTVLPQRWDGRPMVRGDCENGPRPCPWVSCKHHMLLDVVSGGHRNEHRPRIVFARDVDETSEDSITEALLRLPFTCSLDAADEGPAEQDVIADRMGISKQRVEKIESNAVGDVPARMRARLLTGNR